jgi:hypothetical protein
MNDVLANLSARDDIKGLEGWRAWQSPENKCWHAYKIGSEPQIRVHGNSIEDLIEAVKLV